MGYSKSSAEEGSQKYKQTQETGEKSNKLPNFTPNATRKRRNEAPQGQQKERNYKNQGRNKCKRNKETIAKINKAKSWFFEKTNKQTISQTHQETKGEKSNS